VARSFPFIVTIEQERIALVERPIIAHEITQDEGFEEPARMREMPLGGRGVGERLDRRVGVAQRRGEVERQLPRCAEPLTLRRPCSGGGSIEDSRGVYLGTPG
jgi:hypothetical protein